jgi:hypothetical protein
MEVGPQYAEDIPGCVLALYPESYDYNSGGVATWADFTSFNNDFTQSVELNKPVSTTALGVPVVRTGPTVRKNVNIASFNGMPANISSLTILFSYVPNSGGNYLFGMDNGVPGGGLVPGYLTDDAMAILGGFSYNYSISKIGVMSPSVSSFQTVCYVASGTINQARAYVNAEYVPGAYSSTSPVPYTNRKFSIGSHAEFDAGFKDMNYFSFHTWNRALTADEVLVAEQRIRASIARGHR